jgi:NADH-quinone oxidoreductase subunit L
MTLLGVGALFGGLIQIPGVDDLVTKFLDGTFYSSSLYSIVPSTEDSWIGLAVGGTISILGIGLAYLCYVRRPGVTVRLAERFRRTHQFLFNKWYFDELIDALVYRPTIAIGRFSNSVFERVVVQGIVGGTTGVVKGAGSVVRGAQSGFVRAYALLLVGGFAALGIYFLVVSN